MWLRYQVMGNETEEEEEEEEEEEAKVVDDSGNFSRLMQLFGLETQTQQGTQTQQETQDGDLQRSISYVQKPDKPPLPPRPPPETDAPTPRPQEGELSRASSVSSVDSDLFKSANSQED
jgi:hypothetical protein